MNTVLAYIPPMAPKPTWRPDATLVKQLTSESEPYETGKEIR